jgi:predicted amidohydrolase YtcJ
MAISGGRIVATGTNAEMLGLAVGGTKKVDLGGKVVLPGFNDAHAHPGASGVGYLLNVACDSASIAEIQAALRKKAATKAAGAWVLGFLYDDGKTPHPLTIADLDAAVPDHPVYVVHRGGHTAFANSLAFKLAGVTEHTPNPAGGLYEKDAAGRLTGKIGDHAREPFEALIQEKPTREEFRDGAKLITAMLSKNGITSICDAAGSPELLQGYQDARDEGELKMRVYCHIQAEYLDQMMAAGIHTGFGDEMVRVGAVKQFADGSISERTAWLSKPYLDMRDDYTGLRTEKKETLYEIGSKAHKAGWQLGTHCNGDLAIGEVMEVYERIQRETPRKDPRFRLEHCTQVTPEMARRIAALKALPVPFACYVYFHGDVMHFYGEERTKEMFSMRTLLDAGVPVPSSSDFGASPSDAMMWLQSQVTRQDMTGKVWGGNQRITLEEAIRCGTANGAYCSFEEKEKGTLEPGRLADLIVLKSDLWKTEPTELVHVGIERTMVGGRWVYES